MSGVDERRTAVLVDRHPLWLDALGKVLAGADVRVLAKLTSAATAERRVTGLRPDLLITGLRMEGDDLGGLSLIRRCLERAPDLKVVVLSTYDDQAHIDAAFAAGAAAYVVKTAQPEEIVSAVRQAFSRSVFLDGSARSPGRPPAAQTASSPSGLTRRELEILRLVGEGSSNAQVARTLWVTEQTVKFHLSNVYRKLNVSNRTEASRWAQLQGLLGSSSIDVAA